ncbi:hypothetical protein V8J82_12020 [Gymnodinialimonas sp. 2305UL16-5]|uniref:hypothetical protein n=1 Tax=Gymnodinialimonas mytili TaxID=3126503 RepID=UPI0030A88C61
MSGIGHNRGPSLQAGAGFRRVAWQRARNDLMPTLPLQVVRLRVARAKRLGLPYKTYATIRAVSGRDIVGFLFSSNALGMRRDARMSDPVRDRLITLDGQAARLAALHAPIAISNLPEVLDHAARAPGLFTPWRETRDTLRGLARDAHAVPDGVVVVAATALEREWAVHGDFAGVLDPDVIFAPGH